MVLLCIFIPLMYGAYQNKWQARQLRERRVWIQTATRHLIEMANDRLSNSDMVEWTERLKEENPGLHVPPLPINSFHALDLQLPE